MSLEKVLEQRITELAHQIYLERLNNNIEGDSYSDWALAKQMITNTKHVNDNPNDWKLKF